MIIICAIGFVLWVNALIFYVKKTERADLRNEVYAEMKPLVEAQVWHAVDASLSSDDTTED